MHRVARLIGQLRQRLERIMHDAQPAALFSLETFLCGLALVYGGLMALRARLYEKGLLKSHRLPCKVVSIGNIVAGGTGKTPMTIFVAQLIRDQGYRVVVVSRGYHGRMEAKGGVVSDGKELFVTVDDAGDEPFLMARILKDVPVVVGRKRYQAGLLAIKRFDPDVIVLDDAFQHLALKRDFDIVLLDHRFPLGNGYLLPRGTLREPSSALHRAHTLVFTRSPGKKPIRESGLGWAQHRPVFYTAHKPVIRADGPEAASLFLTCGFDLSRLHGRRVFAFAGIADNGQFFATLEKHGCELTGKCLFNDHHDYNDREIDALKAMTVESGADGVVTTLKDYVKIAHRGSWPVELTAVDVTMDFWGAGRRFQIFLTDSLRLDKTER